MDCVGVLVRTIAFCILQLYLIVCISIQFFVRYVTLFFQICTSHQFILCSKPFLWYPRSFELPAIPSTAAEYWGIDSIQVDMNGSFLVALVLSTSFYLITTQLLTIPPVPLGNQILSIFDIFKERESLFSIKVNISGRRDFIIYRTK